MGKQVGEYFLKTKVGSGSFCSVYLAEHLSTKQKVAVKAISRSQLRPEDQSRVDQEILCQCSVENPFIVKLLDVITTDTHFYLVLEYCAGGDLSDFLSSHGPVSECHARRWMQQLVDGLNSLHCKNIIHRDLKLQNILMTSRSVEATLKLADFGLSRVLQDSLAESWLGTPMYMAPEIFKGKAGYDLKADIWSLGVVFYYLLTGESPLPATCREEIAGAHRNLKPFPSYLSRSCVDLLRRMLEPKPRLRLSFEELVVHPFVKDVGLSSEDDFVLLDSDEASADFVYLTKDNHPAVNLKQVVQEAHLQVQVATHLAKLGDIIHTNNEVLGAFAIYVKACTVLKTAWQQARELALEHHLDKEAHPSFYAALDELAQLMTRYQCHTAGLCSEVENLSGSQDWTYSIGSEGLAHSLIYQYAIKLCKEGACEEFIENYALSKTHYEEAATLLEYLCEKQEHTTEWQLVDELRRETNRRLATVRANILGPVSSDY